MSNNKDNEEFNDDFQFEMDESVFTAPVAYKGIALQGSGHRTVDDMIAHMRGKRSVGINDEEEADEEIEVEIVEENEGDDMFVDDKVRDKNAKKRKNDKEPEKFKFTDEVTKFKDAQSFIDMKLTKPLLKALAELGLDKPTPIQSAMIPVALLHRDVCACARTGSGKTAAFLVPIIERLAHKPRGGRNVTRALILSPTRELAVQIFNVAKQLTRYFPRIHIQLSTGGLDLRSQEASLRLSPDVVVATPGRLIDHLANAPTFNLHDIQFLVLDEADKMLDEYFEEQINEIIRQCNVERQTMLLSATMTENVKELASCSLRSPVKIFINQNTDVAHGLQQEFVRVRSQRETDREAMIVSLLARGLANRSIVFLPTKKQCHRMHIVLGLLNIMCAELHGNMTQAQRLESLRKFTETGEVNVLLATDLASRGLDVANVMTVINFNLPATVKQYVHRVGRTARAGKQGRSISLVGEEERKQLKEIVKQAPNAVKVRTINPGVIDKYRSEITALEGDVDEILRLERAEKEARSAEMQLNTAERILNGEKETDRQKRISWFTENKMEKKKKERQQKQEEKKTQVLEKQKVSKKQKRRQADQDSDEEVGLARRDKRGAILSYDDLKSVGKKPVKRRKTKD